MSFVKYKLITDASTIHAFFGEGFPFNIRKDLKEIEDIDDFKKNLLEAVACPDCPPQRCCISKIYIENKLIAFKKYRLTDGKKGKSGGYRCIVLYDEFHQHDDCVIVMIIHVFSKKISDDLKQKEKNYLNMALKRIEDSILKEE